MILYSTAFILVGDDITQVLLVIIFTYFGNYSHRPRLMGLGTLFVAMSCFLASAPHFIYGPGKEAIELAEGNKLTNESDPNARSGK